MSRRSDYGQPPSREPGHESVYDMICVVREAAQRLVREMKRAEAWTSGWSDRRLSGALVETALRRCLATLASLQCWGRDNEMLSHELWRIAGKWLERGWLQSLTRDNSHQFDDSELLTRLTDQTVSTDPLGRTFDEYFIKQSGSLAIRNRSELLASEISRSYLRRQPAEFHILSFGSGPGGEVHHFLQQLSSARRGAVRLTLVDHSSQALQNARLRLHTHAQLANLVLEQENLFRMSEPSHPESVSLDTDFLICPGLFDYLSEAAAPQMLSYLYRRLAPRGRMLVGNFSPHNPTRAYWEWIGNWYLNYRDESSLQQIAAAAGIPESQTRVFADSFGVILYLDVTRRE